MEDIFTSFILQVNSNFFLNKIKPSALLMVINN
jgi:hypothetical protein